MPDHVDEDLRRYQNISNLGELWLDFRLWTYLQGWRGRVGRIAGNRLIISITGTSSAPKCAVCEQRSSSQPTISVLKTQIHILTAGIIISILLKSEPFELGLIAYRISTIFLADRKSLVGTRQA